MRSVLTHASVPGMPIVMLAITEDIALAFLTTLEIPMELHAHRVSYAKLTRSYDSITTISIF